MPDKPELAAARRALLEKYLQGEISPTASETVNKQDDTPLRVPVVPIRSSGSQTPFFYSYVHVDGGAFYCFTLAERMGPDQPFYILEPYRFEEGEAPPSLETMAAGYIEAMRRAQPHGPYLLGGFCGGGLIVFEMAHQLLQQGEAVDLLLLVEPVDGPGPSTYRMVLRSMAGRLMRGVSQPLHIGAQQQLDWFLRIRHYYLLLRYREYRETHKPWLRPSSATLHQDWIGIYVWVIAAYSPKKYPGKVTYLWAEDEFLSRKEWRGKQVEAAEREMIMIRGDHWSCRTEHLQEFAATLEQAVNQARGGAVD